MAAAADSHEEGTEHAWEDSDTEEEAQRRPGGFAWLAVRTLPHAASLHPLATQPSRACAGQGRGHADPRRGRLPGCLARVFTGTCWPCFPQASTVAQRRPADAPGQARAGRPARQQPRRWTTHRRSRHTLGASNAGNTQRDRNRETRTDTDMDWAIPQQAAQASTKASVRPAALCSNSSTATGPAWHAGCSDRNGKKAWSQRTGR